MTGTSTKIGMHLEGYDNGDNTHWEVCKAMGKVEGHVSMFRTQGTDNSSATMRHNVTILLLRFLLFLNFCIPSGYLT